MSSSSTTHCRHDIYSLWPASADYSPPSSPFDLVPIELHFSEIIGSSSVPKIYHNVTKKTTLIPLGALSDITSKEHRTHLEAMSRCLSDLGVPEQTHSKIIADTCRLVNSEVAESHTTPPMIVVNASAFTWVLDYSRAHVPVLPESKDMEDLGFVCC